MTNNVVVVTPIETSPPSGAVDPIVRICLHYEVGAAKGTQWGSGFLPSPWSWSVVTAGHVLALDEGMTAVRVEVHFDVGGSPFVVDATAYASGPRSPKTDCAVVRLAAPVAPTTALPDGSVPSGAFQAVVCGYPEGANVRQDAPTKARESHGMILYQQDVGVPGMSGGPVLVGGAATGIHIGQATGQPGQGATRMDVNLNLLDSLMKAAKAAVQP